MSSAGGEAHGQRKIRVGELFAGIGGISRGLEATGHYKTAWFAEVEQYCQAILRKQWPKVPVYGDVRQIDWSKVQPVDMLAGGFPCQPASTAGRRRGTADERWLWPEFARAVGVLRPRLVLVENVPGLLTVNGGEAFGEVVGPLARLRYDLEWSIVAAAEAGAPHLRKRLFIVAWRRETFDSDGARLAGQSGGPEAKPHSHGPEDRLPEPHRTDVAASSDSSGEGSGLELEEHRGRGQGRKTSEALEPALLRQEDRKAGREGLDAGSPDASNSESVIFTRPPEQSDFWHLWREQPIAEIAASLCRTDDGLPARLHPAHRRHRLQALGNAVVPQVATHVGQLIWEALQRGLPGCPPAPAKEKS